MKCSIPEISWHNREPVLSLDIQSGNKEFYRLATAGSDTTVLIWKLKPTDKGSVDISVLSELTRHQRAVNVVKFSPNGEFLASGDDDSNIIIWKLKTDNIPSLDEAENLFEERWNIHKILRGHKEDVYDISWSPNSSKIISGSVDNTAIVWDVLSGKTVHILSDHKGFVQGVSWDPQNQFLSTLSSDRICRVFDENGFKIKARIYKGVLPVQESHELHSKEVKYFYDDTFKTYFRRLTYSPDGTLLIVPSGSVETEDTKNYMFGTYIFTLDSLKQPIAFLPSAKQCSIVVKCSPLLYELRENGPKPVIDLPYRMIIAVATDSDILLYDTQQCTPCIHLQNIHYTRLTDLTWSSDGRLLAASSTDGYVTMVTFDVDELGVQYIEDCEVDESIIEDVSVAKETKVSPKVTPKTKNAKKIADEKSSSAKKLKGNMSLLNFIKPLSHSQSQSVRKSELKPQKLFDNKDKEEGQENKTTKTDEKVERKEQQKTEIIELVDDSTCDEEFTLRVEESSVEEPCKLPNTEQVLENDKKIVPNLNVEVKTKRRIPLITLSSPKNMKKKC